jgi:hypothetical protein
VSKATKICALIFIGGVGAYTAAVFDSGLIASVFGFVFGWNIAEAHMEMSK